jgi:hypothetical protein
MSDKKPSPEMVGRQFIKKYYERLHNEPETMHRFYQDKSSLIYGEGSNPVEITTGLSAIKSKLSERCSKDWVLSLENGSVDAQQSVDDGVLLMVTGTLTSKSNRQPRQFVQSFFLAAHQTSAYYVLHDTFRVIDIALPPIAPTTTATITPQVVEKVVEPSVESKSVEPVKQKPVEHKTKKKENSTIETPTEKQITDVEPTHIASNKVESETPAAEIPAAPVEEVSKLPFSWANLVKTDATSTTLPPSPPRRQKPPAPQQQQQQQQQQPKQQRQRGNKSRGGNTPPGTKNGSSSNGGGAAHSSQGHTGETELERKSRKLKAALSPEEMPSTAIFVKNLETSVVEEDLKRAFLRFMSDQNPERLLVAGHFDRGFAFIDLGSQEAVARAVSASRSPEGIKVGPKGKTNKNKSGDGGDEIKRVVVEPSQKPVRPSGLKAIHERRGSNSSSNASTPTTSPKLTYNKGKAHQQSGNVDGTTTGGTNANKEKNRGGGGKK